MPRTKSPRLSLSAIPLLLLSACFDSRPIMREAITIIDGQRDYRSLISLVKENYPEIDVEIEPYRGRNMSAYFKQQLETGSMPDIYSTTQAWDSAYQEQNLLDLSQYGVTGLYNSARLHEYAVDGKIYLLPFDYTISGIAYNKTLFDRLNISVPQSFAELKNVTIPSLKSNNINVSSCLFDLPGSAFNYFFNIAGTSYMSTKEGREWRSQFSDKTSSVFASSNSKVASCASLFQEWIDCGMLCFEEGVSNSQSVVEAQFREGNTAFMIGTIKRFSQNDDGSGDQYALMPWLSEDGKNNIYITQPGRLYGINKKLSEPGNEQKLKDALNFLEVLSTNEGYVALNGLNSSNLCSIADFKTTFVPDYYKEALEDTSKGKSMDLVYTGWDDYLKPFGYEILDWVKGKEGKSAASSLLFLDSFKESLKKNGTTYYAEVIEELNTVEAAQLTGQIFMDKISDAAGALVSYNVYNKEISADLENSYGANGRILKGKMSEEYITIWLATGWSEEIKAVRYKGSKLKEMAKKGTDTRKTGFYYPYVFMTRNGEELEDEKEYLFILVGHNRAERESIEFVETGVVGLDAAKEYLLKKKTISKATLENNLVISTEKAAKAF